MKTIDLMLDLETLGTAPGCSVLSIGAASFDLSYTFYEKISSQSCKERGLNEDPETIAWWAKQNPTARKEAFSGTTTLEVGLGRFADFVRMLPASNRDIFIWGNGADFDQPILMAAYDAVGMKWPGARWNNRCFRTLKNLYKDMKEPIFEGMKHSALEDAKHQARWGRLILSKHFRTQE